MGNAVEITPTATLVCGAYFTVRLRLVLPTCNSLWWKNTFPSPFVNAEAGFVLIHHCDTLGCKNPVTVWFYFFTYHTCFLVCQYYMDYQIMTFIYLSCR